MSAPTNKAVRVLKFQSPCGEEVMQLNGGGATGKVVKEFQSPCGEEVMQQN